MQQDNHKTKKHSFGFRLDGCNKAKYFIMQMITNPTSTYSRIQKT